MVRQRLQPWLDRLKLAITEPRSELDRWELAARFTYDLGWVGARQLRQDKAPQMAAALGFRTLFGFLPVLVVGTVLVRAFRGLEAWQSKLEAFLANLGWNQIGLTDIGAGEGGEEQGATLSEWVLGYMQQAEQVNISAIGWVGLAVVCYSAIGLMFTIENSFNSIYRAPEGRSWVRRIPIYWTVLTFGPLAIALTMYFSDQLDEWIQAHVSSGMLLRSAPYLWSFFATWLVMFAIYRLIPNTSVAARPALAGGCVAALLIEIGKGTLAAYFGNAVSFSQLYGSLGLIPVFMFWVYVMWLVVLFGLEVSAILQSLGGRQLVELERKRQAPGFVDPAAVLMVMEIVAEHFDQARPANAREIAESAAIAEPNVLQMLESLADAGFVHWLDRDEGKVILARPPEHISAEQLIEIGFTMVDERTGRRSSLVQRLRDAQRTLASDMTLASPTPVTE